MGYCEQFTGCLRRSRMEKEAIYCNGISYLYFFFFFPWLLCGDACLGERHRVGEADSVSQQAACQRVEKKRQTSGSGWEQRRSGSGGEQICLWFVWDLRANFWLMRREGASPDRLLLTRHLSDNTHFFDPFSVFSPLMFISCQLKPRLSLGQVSTSNSH